MASEENSPLPEILCVDVVKSSGEHAGVVFRDPKPTVARFKEELYTSGFVELEGFDLSHNNQILSDERLMSDGMVVEIVIKEEVRGLTPPCCC